MPHEKDMLMHSASAHKTDEENLWRGTYFRWLEKKVRTASYAVPSIEQGMPGGAVSTTHCIYA